MRSCALYSKGCQLLLISALHFLHMSLHTSEHLNLNLIGLVVGLLCSCVTCHVSCGHHRVTLVTQSHGGYQGCGVKVNYLGSVVSSKVQLLRGLLCVQTDRMVLVKGTLMLKSVQLLIYSNECNG